MSSKVKVRNILEFSDDSNKNRDVIVAMYKEDKLFKIQITSTEHNIPMILIELEKAQFDALEDFVGRIVCDWRDEEAEEDDEDEDDDE
jgi:hypothetical protein